MSPNGAQGNHLRLRQGEQGSHFPGPTVRLPGPGAHGCQPHSLLGNTQSHLHSPRSKSRYFITSFFLFKSELKINVPSVLRCISLVQPAHIPPRCPFQNMAGERRKEMEREREPVHPASMPVDCTSSKRETLQAWPRRRVERAQKTAGTRESGRRANSQNFQPSLHPILLQDLGQIAHPIFAPIYSSYHGWGPLRSSRPLAAVLFTHLSTFAASLPLKWPAMGPGDYHAGSGHRKSWTQSLVLVFTSHVTAH